MKNTYSIDGISTVEFGMSIADFSPIIARPHIDRAVIHTSNGVELNGTFEIDPITKQQFTALFGKPIHFNPVQVEVTRTGGNNDIFITTRKHRQVLLTQKVRGKNFARPVFNRVWQFRMNVKPVL